MTVRPADPADPGDLAALREFFAGLSVRTRYRRFFAAVTPTAAMLRYLSGGAGADGAARCGVHALVARCGGTIVGHAIAVDGAGDGGFPTTEIGVVVADAWQGHGVGAALTRSLISAAQARGVNSVTMEVQHGNRRVLAMIASHWPGARTGHGPDCATVRVQLERSECELTAGLPAPVP
ncbi:MAG TPA: GNAT family N-acetyltransferase [Streptosporangiaceae bacterium]